MQLLTDVLRARAEERRESLAYLFLHNGEEQEERLSYGELDRRARSIAAGLQRDGLVGERALLLYPPGLDFIAAFWGCLYAGVVAVPAYPPRSSRTLPRLRAIARDARPAAALTTAEILTQVQGFADAMPEAAPIRWRATDMTQELEPAEHWTPLALKGDDLAFLQYTSGSTATPKGVMVSHANLVHNEEMVRRAFRQSERSIVVGWLPVYHDMGLIGNVLQPLFVGGSCVLMSPASFLQRPRRWLEAISRFRATTSGGPNFAYDLCVRKISVGEREGLDLSSWEVAFNGAEPVRAETLDRFVAAFAPHGFRREAFYPCYGLAEATLFAAGGRGGEPPSVLTVRAADLEYGRAVSAAAAEAARSFVGCGNAWMEQWLAIVNAESGVSRGDGEVGEIWLSGPSVAQGYWGKLAATEETFGARLAGDDRPWLRTGDLGFLASGELFITGRMKDLIILRGRNHYPQDIELTVESCHQALRPGCGAAFSVERDGEERLVVVQELDRRAKPKPEELAALFDAVRSGVAEQHEVQVHEVVLISYGAIPKTSSGKIQRHACRAGYLDGSLGVVARSLLGTEKGEAPTPVKAGRAALLALPPEARREALDRQLGARIARLLDISAASLAADRPLTAYGLDSLAAVELQSSVEEELGVAVSLSLLLEGATPRELSEAVLRDLVAEAVPAPTAPEIAAFRSAAGGEFPLSQGQRGLWFLDRLAPESAACHIAAAARVHGAVDIVALAAAWRALALRHPALRTTFAAPDGEPRQHVAEQLDPEILDEDASAWEEAELRARLADHAFKPFDLERGPLLRIGLFRRNAGEHLLLLAVHHLVADFGSLAMMVRELARLMSGEPLPETPELSFTDFVRWEAEHLTGIDGERLWTYWRERLAGLAPLELPTDRPRPPLQTFRGGSASVWLDGLQSARIEALGPLFPTLLAAFQALLSRIGGQEDFAVGAPASLRTGAWRDVVGYLVNPIVLRADLAGDPPFAELLARARRRSAEALENRDFPLPLLVERLQLRGARSPLFQVLLSLERGRLPEERPLAAFALGEEGARVAVAGWQLEALAFPSRPAQFDLTLVAAELNGRLGLSWQYDADLFDAATAARALGHFQTLLLAAAEEPGQRLSKLPLLTPAEQRQLAAWNDTAAEVPAEPGIYPMIAAQARRTPEATALICEERRLTYAELTERAGQLAQTLIRLGVRPGALVGHLCDRSPEMLVGLLGTLAAGGAYVPLDPAFPRERLVWMLEDAWRDLEPGRRPVLLTERSLLAVLPDLAADPQVVFLDEPMLTGGGASPKVEVDRADLAYVIYTSGSTGRPKGVAVSHGAVANFLASMARQPGLAAKDVLVAVTTLSFDIAGLELYLPLSVGGTVVIASRETASDGRLLAGALDRYGATALQATPATWRLLLDSGWSGRPGLKLLCGGEALPRDLADHLLPLGSELWNVYGPTETTIWSACHRVEPGRGAVPIGRPIANTSLYVVDRGLDRVPAGVPGELLIGGAGLARGYFGRPDLTAERFLPDPFNEPSGLCGRLYRTGDLARFRPDGTVECLGRLDHQVKVRGFRIELQEIEARLALHPLVRQAVVVARGEAGDRSLVSYIVPASPAGAGSAPAPGELRAFLKESLPDYMIPARWVFLEALPLTPNGKVDRKALPIPDSERPAPDSTAAAPVGETERAVAAIWQEVLGIEHVGADDNFFDLGGHSLLLARIQARLRDRLAADLRLVELFRYPTVRSLAARLASPAARPAPVAAPSPFRAPERGRPEIAIIGMAGRFPGAGSIDELWRRLRAGEELISFWSEEELRREGVDPELLADPSYVRAAGVVEDADRFDAAFFGFGPGEAALTDPQHRVFLECAWEALEDAGYDSERHRGRIGVYAGVGINTYLHYAGYDVAGSPAGRYQAFIGNDKDFVPTRVSYKLNLRGPSVNVQTACSSSLVALHLACQALTAGECDMALVGGVSIRTPQKEGYLWEEGGIPSPDGHCRAFDARARGTVFGNGAGIVVLKRLDQARADGDRVRAVVKGSAINNDGSGKVGYTAPGLDGQAQVVAAALAAADVSPKSISYIEAHGTGTALGDPIEVAALTEVFADAERSGRCALGSVKTNLGHLDTAAGVIGLIKTVLALEHGEIPASLHFETPNPQIDFTRGPFYVNSALTPWPADDGPRRAGVSSFGIGGTNVHVVLEEAPPAEPAGTVRPWQLLTISARTPEALEETTVRLAEHLQSRPELRLADVAHTLQIGRRAFPHRRFLVCRETAEAVAALSPVDPERVATGAAPSAARPVVFLFSGQGAQHAGMARGLYENEPTFRRDVDLCAESLRGPLGRDLRDLLFPPPEREAEAGRELERTELAQPALFLVEYALARLLMEWGVRPDALLGHSVGELVAACLAGVFSLHDALPLVVARGRLMGALPSGAMLSVELPAAEVSPWLGSGLALAAVNAPASCVVSGPVAEVEALERELTSAGARCRRLHTSHAFHSAMMDPILDAFAAEVARVERRPPRLRYISNVSGDWIRPDEAVDPAYWSRHLRSTVRFAAGVRTLLAADSGSLLLEVGPGGTLASLVRQQLPAGGTATVLAALRHPRDPQPDEAVLLRTLGRLWTAGAPVDWQAFGAGERRFRVPLPTYPFQRQLYRLTPADRRQAKTDPLRRKTDLTDWFWAPSWRQTAPPRSSPALLNPEAPWLLFGGEAGDGLLGRLAERITARGGRVIRAQAADAFARREAWDALLAELKDHGGLPRPIVHAWCLGPLGPGAGSEEAQWRAYDSVVALAQALERAAPSGEVEISLLSDGLHRVAGEGGSEPGKALLLGTLRVIPQELPQLRCRAIDVILPITGSDEEGEMAADLLAELTSPPTARETVVAWRGGERFVRDFTAAPITADENVPLRPKGVYLITGGFGGIGLTLAADLARCGARLALVGRNPRTEPLQHLESLGAEVLPLAADVTDEEALRAAIRATEDRFGPLHGVVHAAGLPGGRLLQLVTPEETARVMAPKVRGTLALHRALGDRPLDFLLLCSSITASLGGVGQSDYCAANAFLDAFARSAHRRGPRRNTVTVAVGWDRWEEVGMAARSAPGLSLWGTPGAPSHPLLGSPAAATPERRIFRTEMRVETHWVLSEHRIAGRPTVPGTTYLEMARAAASSELPGRPVEIREAVFLAPLALAEGEAREVWTILDREGEGFTFRIVSRPQGSADPEGQEHARGRVAAAEATAPGRRDLPALLAACSSAEITSRRERSGDGAEFLVTGPRWQSLQRLHLGQGEGLAVLALDPAFAADLESCALHPALLDAAAGAVQFLSEGDFLPLAYERLRVWAPLAVRNYSHLRLRGTPGEILTCDIEILNENGAVLAEAQGFSMRRIGQAMAAQLQAGRGEASRVPLPQLPTPAEPAAGGISPREGVEVFHRILSSKVPCLIVSTRDLPAAMEKADQDTVDRLAGGLATAPAAPVHARPEVSSAYAPPGDDLEGRVAEVWQRVLGIEKIGIHDNFFELGGTSLSGVQLIAELKKQIGTNIPTVSIFEAPTIAALVRYLRPQPRQESLADSSRQRAEKKMRALEQARRAAGQRAR
jgi:amino acid adenylation domain-containing protein